MTLNKDCERGRLTMTLNKDCMGERSTDYDTEQRLSGREVD